MKVQTKKAAHKKKKTRAKLTEKIGWSVDETCASAGVKRDFLYEEINSGRLKTAKIRGRRIIRPESAKRWLADQENATTKAMGFKETAQ